MKPIENPTNATAVRVAINGAPNFFAKVDNNGNLLLNKIFAKPIYRTGSPNIQTYIPDQDELVTFPDYNGMLAVGNGTDRCFELDWIGEYHIVLNEEVVSNYISDPSQRLDLFFNTGIRKASIGFSSDLFYQNDESYLPIFSAFVLDPKCETHVYSRVPQLGSVSFEMRSNSNLFLTPQGTDATNIINADSTFSIRFEPAIINIEENSNDMFLMTTYGKL